MVKNLMEIASRCLQKQMIMVGHETEAVDLCSIAFGSGFEIEKKSFVVLVPPEDGFSLVPSGGDMVECPSIFDP